MHVDIQQGIHIGAYINKAGPAQSTIYIEIENHGSLFTWSTLLVSWITGGSRESDRFL